MLQPNIFRHKLLPHIIWQFAHVRMIDWGNFSFNSAVRGSNSAVADKPLAATERINLFFSHSKSLFAHTNYIWSMFIGVLGQVAFIFYEDIVESFKSKKQLQLSALLLAFKFPWNKIVSQSLCTHTWLTQKMLIFLHAEEIMKNR